jgi:transposase
MRIDWKSAEDRARVWNGYRRAIERRETDQRDRYNAILLLGDGGSDGEELEGDEIATRIGRSPRFLDKWRARYCVGGFDAIVPGKAKGNPAKLTPEQDEQLRQRLNAGPREEDGVCSLRGKDICRIVKEEFGVIHTLGGIYDVLQRIGYSCLVPRPKHRKRDPQAVAAFIENAPFLSSK